MSEETFPIAIPVTPGDAHTTASVRTPGSTPGSTTSLPSQTVTIPLEQLQAFTSVQARLAQMEADQRARDEAARAELVKAMAAKGQIEEALRTVRDQAQKDLETERRRLAQAEERAKRYALEGQLAQALATQPLVTGGAEQLAELWCNKFIVEPQGETFNVRTPDYQPVSAWITAQLGRPEFAHFLRAKNPDGGTLGGPPRTQGTPTGPTSAATAMDQPRNMGEAIALKMAGVAKTTAANANLSGGSRLSEAGAVIREPADGFGLRPLARQA
jgi:hypothetical protein